jgi:hypothetical protein
MYIQPKRRGALEGSMSKTTNYINRASLLAHGKELLQVACNCTVERKHISPVTNKVLPVLLLTTCFGFCEKQ